MLRRKVIGSLEKWRDGGSGKCLIVEGARQVGKTYIIREFGKQYKSFIELNFIENPSLKNIFRGSLDPDSVITGIRLYMPGAEIIPGETLVFLDEIQECAEAVTALKFLAADDRFSVICSGSALGIEYKTGTSYPVGSVDYVHMNSLDIEEFLWAVGVDEVLIGELRAFMERRDFNAAFPMAFDDMMNKLLRQYMVLGGMPEVVQTFVDSHDYAAADAVQRRLYRDYLNDIARYADPDIKIKAEECYKAIPTQLNKPNHKFQYSKVEHGGNAARFGSSISWLTMAHMVIPVYSAGTLEYPLKANAVMNNFRLYPNDIGMLICAYGYELKAAIMSDKSVEGEADNILLGTAKGGLYEALAADMLSKAGHDELYFYRNEPGTIEIEFLIEGASGVVPVEIKAGRNRSRSLDTILKQDDIRYGYKLSSQKPGQAEKKIALPLYLAMFI
ncbi:MAG: ATP-binding protein [Eubacterium sp.]|nr:ATP-binding protein [Eubacterium sp.]